MSYAHMCRDGHIEIGHNDSSHEICPLCRARTEIERLYAALKGLLVACYEDDPTALRTAGQNAWDVLEQNSKPDR